MRLRLKKIFVIFVLVGCINLPFASAQEMDLAPLGAKKPVMYSVFWNTLWGSAWGASMGFSYHLVSGIKLRESLISATTIGGILGYGLGIYLVVSGLSFDKSFLLQLPAPKFQPQPQNAAFLETEMIPLYTRLVKPDPTKLEVPIYAFRF
jgi:hypothetical protein